jgi:hypothetical protein
MVIARQTSHLKPMPTATLVTTTGDRPATFALVEKWIARQTFHDFTWLVVDDGATPTVPTMGQTYLRRARLMEEPEHTLPLQWLYALPHIQTDYVIPIEDDDFVSPLYVQRCIERLQHHALVGEGWAVYCHVPRQWVKHHNNSAHASLAATAFRMEDLGWLMEQSCRGSIGPCVDSRIWDVYQGRKRVYANEGLVTQLKGAPGRKGTLPSHFDSRGYVQDTDDAVLRQRVGADYADIVRVFRGGQKT